MSKPPEAVAQGDVLVLDVAVFHRAGVDGACHIEEEVAYVLVDEPSASALCVLTVEQEEALDPAVVGVIKTLSLDMERGMNGIESHPNVYEFVRAEDG